LWLYRIVVNFWFKLDYAVMTTFKIHILDDEPDLLALVADLSRSRGLATFTYNNASELFSNIDCISSEDILVLDLQLPNVDGIEVLRRFSESQISPRLILVSGLNVGVLHSAEKLAVAHGLDVIGSLSKPFSMLKFGDWLTEKVADNTVVQPVVSPQQISAEELAFAISNGQLVLYFQPQYNLRDKVMTGAEALVRWQHPRLGLVYPDQFISIAEKEGLINSLTRWVIGECVVKASQWQGLGYPLVMSVNVSADDVTSLLLPEQIAHILQETDLDPSRIVLELTESALMGELVTSLDILTRIRLRGIQLSIDDFGTGYSSLSLLHRVPFTELKIDREFVGSMDTDVEARAIVKTCILLAHELNMTVVAEGIENLDQYKLLQALGCDRGQGYMFSPAITGEDFDALARAAFPGLDTWPESK